MSVKKGAYERASISPADQFERPVDVIKSSKLSDKEKKKILDEWEVDAQALSRASDDGMGDGEASHLHEVQDARRKISKGDDSRDSADEDRRTSGRPPP